MKAPQEAKKGIAAGVYNAVCYSLIDTGTAVSKFDGRKIGKEIGMQGLIELAKAIKTSADMYLDDMKVKIDAVYYSKGMQGWERSSFAGLENELDELSYF